MRYNKLRESDTLSKYNQPLGIQEGDPIKALADSLMRGAVSNEPLVPKHAPSDLFDKYIEGIRREGYMAATGKLPKDAGALPRHESQKIRMAYLNTKGSIEGRNPSESAYIRSVVARTGMPIEVLRAKAKAQGFNSVAEMMKSKPGTLENLMPAVRRIQNPLFQPEVAKQILQTQSALDGQGPLGALSPEAYRQGIMADRAYGLPEFGQAGQKPMDGKYKNVQGSKAAGMIARHSINPKAVKPLWEKYISEITHLKPEDIKTSAHKGYSDQFIKGFLVMDKSSRYKLAESATARAFLKLGIVKPSKEIYDFIDQRERQARLSKAQAHIQLQNKEEEDARQAMHDKTTAELAAMWTEHIVNDLMSYGAFAGVSLLGKAYNQITAGLNPEETMHYATQGGTEEENRSARNRLALSNIVGMLGGGAAGAAKLGAAKLGLSQALGRSLFGEAKQHTIDEAKKQLVKGMIGGGLRQSGLALSLGKRAYDVGPAQAGKEFLVDPFVQAYTGKAGEGENQIELTPLERVAAAIPAIFTIKGGWDFFKGIRNTKQWIEDVNAYRDLMHAQDPNGKKMSYLQAEREYLTHVKYGRNIKSVDDLKKAVDDASEKLKTEIKALPGRTEETKALPAHVEERAVEAETAVPTPATTTGKGGKKTKTVPVPGPEAQAGQPAVSAEAEPVKPNVSGVPEYTRRFNMGRGYKPVRVVFRNDLDAEAYDTISKFHKIHTGKAQEDPKATDRFIELDKTYDTTAYMEAVKKAARDARSTEAEGAVNAPSLEDFRRTPEQGTKTKGMPKGPQPLGQNGELLMPEAVPEQAGAQVDTPIIGTTQQKQGTQQAKGAKGTAKPASETEPAEGPVQGTPTAEQSEPNKKTEYKRSPAGAVASWADETLKGATVEEPTPGEYHFTLANGKKVIVKESTYELTDEELYRETGLTREQYVQRYGSGPVSEARISININGKDVPAEALIEISSGGARKRSFLHEAAHVAKEFGLWTPEEWADLKRTYGEPALRKHPNRKNLSKEQREAVMEEAVMDALARYKLGEKPASLLERAKQFFRNIVDRLFNTSSRRAKAASKEFASGTVFEREGGFKLERYMPDRFKHSIEPVNGPKADNPTKIILDLKKFVTVYKGKMLPYVRGTYHPAGMLVRIKYAGDLETTSHELAHYLDDNFKVMDFGEISPTNKDLVAVAKELRQKAFMQTMSSDMPVKQKLNEAFAEWLRHYVMDPVSVRKATPEMYARFKEKMGAALPEFERWASKVREYEMLPAGTKIKAQFNIGADTEPGFFRQLLDVFDPTSKTGIKFRMAFTNDLHPLEVAFEHIKRLTGQTEVAPSNDPTILARRHRYIDSIIDDVFTHGVRNLQGEHYSKTALTDVFDFFNKQNAETMTKDFDDMQALAVAKRILEKTDQGYDPKHGIAGKVESDVKAARDFINEMKKDPERFERLNKAHKKLVDFSNDLLNYASECGLLSKAEVAKIIKENEQFIKFKELSAMLEEQAGHIANPLQSVKKPYERFSPGMEEKAHPFIASMYHFRNVMIQADRNRVISTLASHLMPDRTMYGKPARTSDIGYVTGAGEPGKKIAFYVNGKKVYVKLEPTLMDAIENLSVIGDSNLVVNAVKSVVRFRRNALTMSPAFAVRNVVRDTVDHMIMTPSKASPLKSGEGRVSLKSIFSKPTDEKLSDLAYYGGGASERSLVDSPFDYDRSIKQFIKENSGKKSVFLNPAKLWHNYQNLIKRSEIANRKAAFKAAYENAIKRGMSKEDAKLYAGDVARDTLNFLRAGKIIRKLNQYIPFLNAGIQGALRSYKAILTQPDRVLKRAAVFYTASVALEQLWNRTLGADQEYDQLPDQQKGMFFNLKAPGIGWIRIPKGHMFWAFGNIMERAMRRPEDKHAFEGFLSSAAKSYAVLDVFSVYPPEAQLMLNKDVFRGRDIVPSYEEGMELKYRRPSSTAEPLGKLGQKLLNVDARKVDFYMSSYLGDWYKSSNALLRWAEGNVDPAKVVNISGLAISQSPYSLRDFQYLSDVYRRVGRANPLAAKASQIAKMPFGKARDIAMKRFMRDARIERKRAEASPPQAHVRR